MDKQRHRPVLVELWDMTQPASMRTIAYMNEWHARYAEAGLRVIGVHTASRPEAEDEAAIEAAVKRLGINYPVVVDTDGEIWSFYGPQGYPSRYLFNGDFRLEDIQVGEGGYTETEELILGLLDLKAEPFGPVRPEDSDDALIVVPSAERPGLGSGPYAAGSVWLSVTGSGTVVVNGTSFDVDGPAALEVVTNPVHTEGDLTVTPDAGVTVLATCFAPGIAA
ncbi:MAG: redoxin domain-containing protein [Actinomycetes bacterium]